jgi:hypothetical protein
MNDDTAPSLSPDDAATSKPDTSAAEPAARAPATSKSDCVTKLLRRGKGATIAELQEATAWQPHSVRAFLSGLRKKGMEVSKEQRRSGETAYRLASKPTAAASTDA